MAMAPHDSFDYEVEKSTDESNNAVTTVKCRGRLVSDTAGEIRGVVRPLITQGGRIVLDFTDLEHLDSSGLGTLVGLKASSLNTDYCRLELINLSPRVADLLRVTKLTPLFAS